MLTDLLSYKLGSAARKRQAAEVTASLTWGWLPALSLCVAGALLLTAYANNLARAGVPEAAGLFWASLLVLLIPCAARLCAPGAARDLLAA